MLQKSFDKGVKPDQLSRAKRQYAGILKEAVRVREVSPIKGSPEGGLYLFEQFLILVKDRQ